MSDKEWMYGHWSRTPTPPQPMAKCSECGKARNQLETRLAFSGRVVCVECLQRAVSALKET